MNIFIVLLVAWAIVCYPLVALVIIENMFSLFSVALRAIARVIVKLTGLDK